MINIIGATEAYAIAYANREKVIQDVFLGVIQDKILEAISEGNTKIFYPCDRDEMTKLGIVDYLIKSKYTVSFTSQSNIEGITISCKPLSNKYKYL